MNSTGLSIVGRLSTRRDHRATFRHWLPLLVLVAGLNIAFAYAAFDRGALEITLGGVIGCEILAFCIFRPRPALLAFVGFWGVAHVLLSNGENTGSASTSISQLVGVTVVLGFGVAVAELNSRRGSRPLPLAIKAFATFAVMYAVAELITPLHAAGLSDLIKLVGGLVLAIVGYYMIDNEKRLLTLTRVVGVAGILVAVVALVQSIAGISLGMESESYAKTTGLYRATSALGGASATADFLLVCAGFALLRYTLERDRHRAHVALSTLAIISMGIVVTFTRSAVVGLVVMLVVWATLWQVRSISAIGIRARLAIIFVAIAIGVVQAVGGAALTSRIQGQTASSGASFLNGRNAIWSNELQTLQTASFSAILIGRGAHTSYTSVYVPQSGKSREFPPHDLFLWLVVETGVVGLFVYVAGLFVLSSSFLRVARRSRFTLNGRVAGVAFATTVAFILDSMFHNTQVSTGSNWYFMLFVGATLRMIEARP